MNPKYKAKIERVEKYDDFSFGGPSNDDYLQTTAHTRIFYHGPEPHRGSGFMEGGLPRLRDGEGSRNVDDKLRSIWFDKKEGHIVIDLGEKVPMKMLNVYSHHRINRSPQNFLVFGSKEAQPDFDDESGGDWEILSWVNTKKLGDGWKHGSSIQFPEGDEYRFLMLVIATQNKGTFFNEIDVEIYDR